jgi:hypothetical protein
MEYIECTDLLSRASDRSRMDASPNFLKTGVARKLYLIYEGHVRLFPDNPHAHSGEHTIVPLLGEITLAYQDNEGTIHNIDMMSGKTYRVLSGIPHHIRAKGLAAMEVFYPPETLVSRKHWVRVINDRFFTSI